MAKRVLMVATVSSTIGQFNMNNIRILQEMDYEVDVASDFTDRSSWPAERVGRLKKELAELKVSTFQLDFSRSIFKLNRHVKSFQDTVKLIRDRKYAFIHTHTPVASSIVRLAARKTGTKVIYTAHGFHFYDGAPLRNWILYYPIEKVLSNWTNILITINKEDYQRAKKKFGAKKTVYVPGVGVDTEKLAGYKVDRNKKRDEFGINANDFLIVSVGELNENKNHQVIIRAIEKIPEVKYIIVGNGIYEKNLRKLANRLGVENKVFFTGYRTDISDILGMADVFAFPSRREGLGLAAIEALAVGLPLVTSRSGGIKDYSIDGVTGYSCDSEDVEGFTRNIRRLIREKKSNKDKWEGYGMNNKIVAKRFDYKKCDMRMKKIYESI